MISRLRQTLITILLVMAFIFSLFLSSSAFYTQSQSTQAVNHTIRYEYDHKGQLIRATYGEQLQIRFAYDAAGNLLRREVPDPQTRIHDWQGFE